MDPPPRVVALVGDLMDGSRITAAVPDAVTVRDAAQASGAAVVVVDLGRHGALVGDLRRVAPDAHLVAFGRHDDTAALRAARAAGADRVLARSTFFADVAGALDPTATGTGGLAEPGGGPAGRGRATAGPTDR